MTLEKIKEKLAAVRIRLAVSSVMLTGLVGMASAATLNDSIGPVITGLVQLMAPLLATVLAAIPLIITLAIASFIVALIYGLLKSISF